MNPVKTYLSAIAFSLAGAAVHADAAAEKRQCPDGVCFQQTPVADQSHASLLSENGSSRTPQGRYLEEQQANAQA
ncbi:hypothetical protein [Pseudomonas gingeri]|uniref:Uncharacterized protein n=1 Tax=Pseudomonas gingeri TaxID=117681 RepID=A0A7Y7YCY5_9PSED|nr:hypothetical protein [Pseudomonas gingeri]NWB30012.1 hypothetical protein [Pseudomonas gingeri]NWC33601.1 hypothetical protein [Pseudomonas gingeri]